MILATISSIKAIDHTPINSQNFELMLPKNATSANLDPNKAPVQVQCAGGWASGIAVSGAPKGKTYVVTNKHVVDMPHGGTAIRINGKECPSRVVARSSDFDVAVLVVDIEIPFVKISNSDPVVGTKVTLRGNGIETGWDDLRNGEITSCDGSSLTSSVRTSAGDSGSGYLNSNGELVGICWGGLSDSSVGVPASKIKNTISSVDLNSLEIKKEKEPEIDLSKIPKDGVVRRIRGGNPELWTDGNGGVSEVPHIFADGTMVPLEAMNRFPYVDPRIFIGHQHITPAGMDLINKGTWNSPIPRRR